MIPDDNEMILVICKIRHSLILYVCGHINTNLVVLPFTDEINMIPVIKTRNQPKRFPKLVIESQLSINAYELSV